MTTGVYKITCCASNDFYIGSSAHIEGRWYQHKNNLCRGVHPNRKMQRVFDSNGLFSFSIEILQSTGRVTRCELLALEADFIERLNPTLNHEAEAYQIRHRVAKGFC